MNKLLVMGLPGSGKTTFCQDLINKLPPALVNYLNADNVRNLYDDWDFTPEGRIRQAYRMRSLCVEGKINVVDMVSALPEQRDIINAGVTVWMNTIESGRFEDTNRAFVPPVLDGYDDLEMVRWAEKNDDGWPNKTDSYIEILSDLLVDRIPHGLMVGRFQPWHSGHRALFEEIQKKHGMVCIGIRNTYRTSKKDPYSPDEVERMIIKDLDKDFAGCYSIQILPNITGIHWGRDVGYETGQIKLPDEIEAISATQIRSKT